MAITFSNPRTQSLYDFLSQSGKHISAKPIPTAEGISHGQSIAWKLLNPFDPKRISKPDEERYRQGFLAGFLGEVGKVYQKAPADSPMKKLFEELMIDPSRSEIKDANATRDFRNAIQTLHTAAVSYCPFEAPKTEAPESG